MLFSLILPSLMFNQQPDPDFRLIPSSGDAVAMAWSDMQTIPPVHRPAVRWVRLRKHKDLRQFRTLALTLNWDSQSSFLSRPPALFDHQLVRVDLRNYDPTLKDWKAAWERLAFDPDLSVLVTKDQAKFNSDAFFASLGLFRAGTVVTVVKRRDIVHPGGRFVYPPDTKRDGEVSPGVVVDDMEAGNYHFDVEVEERSGSVPVTQAWALAQLESVNVVKLNPPDVDPKMWLELQQATGSLAPVVSEEYLKFRMLSTITEDGLFKEVFGGLYFDFKGIKKSTVKGTTDLDLFIESLGIGSEKERFLKLISRVQADLWAGMIRSQVTGKPRAIVGLDVLTRDVNSKGFITFDIKDKDIDLASRAFANITNPQGFAQAYEAIFPHRNGLPIVGLFNGDQALQDEAPSGQGGVVDDTTVPPPHTHRLQSSISCIRCHGKHDFWQPVQNDIPTLYAAELRTDPNDVGRFLDPQNATRLRLIGQYGGDGIPRHLERNRIDFRAKIRECVEIAPGNVWEGSDPKASPGWTDVGQKVTEFLGNEWNQYIYGTIDAEQALWEIGIEVTPKQGEQEPERKRRAVAVFNRLVPVGLLSGVSGLLTEDPRIKALRVGMAVSRQDWGLVRGYVSGSIRRTPTRKAA